MFIKILVFVVGAAAGYFYPQAAAYVKAQIARVKARIAQLRK
jgi:hypothetical protein